MRLEDPWAVAAQLFAPCYIGGWSAAEHWDLTEQVFRDVCVMTATRPRDRKQALRGTRFQLHSIPQDRLFGMKTVWRGRIRVQLSDPIRTVADMLADPSLGGGIRHVVDILQALTRGYRGELSRVIADLDRLKNGAAFKRLGYLLETAHPAETTLIEECRRRLTAGYVKLDPAIPSGRLITAWRLWTPSGTANWRNAK
ncbi:MAG: type IV toxin-antitoxin system AbiEi family antitoxin domain-containing protein [Burkholderiales bacterium]